MIVVQVALPVPLNRAFDYRLADNMPIPPIGSRVLVPFGKRQALGVVVDHSHSSELPEDQLKTVDLVLDHETLFPDDLWQLLLWSAQYYHYPIGEVLFHALPILLRQGNRLNFHLFGNGKLHRSGKSVT